jgi:Zn-finger nucleic acid-binding protein
MGAEPEEIGPDELREGSRACPVCGATMRVALKRGIHMDVCEAHGIWLDHGELDQITMKLTRKLSRHAAKRVRGARREGALRGSLFGWWALLGD